MGEMSVCSNVSKLKNIVHWLETHGLFIKEKVNKVMLTIFWDMNEPLTIGCLEQSATVNSESDGQILRQNSLF